ncbi:MAG: M81 family metallopeptidase [Caldilineaceae bacterium]
MKIFAGGIGTETNTFSPMPTGIDDFDVAHKVEDAHKVIYGTTLDVYRRLAAERGWDFAFGLYAFAQPAGTTVRSAYETLRDELLDSLAAALPVDIVLLTMHGAMVADGYDDCESDIVHRVRGLVGPNAKIGIELDLHCDIVQQMVEESDAIVLFKEYPHVDVDLRAAELFTIIANAAEGKSRPTMALFDCYMTGLFLTPFQPMRSFVDEMMKLEGKDGVLSISLAHSFPQSDVPSMGVYLLTITENNPQQAAELAEQLGRKFYSLRHQVMANHPPLHEALDIALNHIRTASVSKRDHRPIVFADTGDNAGGGAPSDSTYVLAELLRRAVHNVGLGMVWDPIVVRLAMAAGVGANLQVRLGGKLCPLSGDPLDLNVTVKGIVRDMVQHWPRQNGPSAVVPCGDSVWLACDGIDIIVNSRRTQVLGTDVFTNFGIDINRRDLLVVKSTQHFYAAFAPIAAQIVYSFTPGVLNENFLEIPYQRINKLKFPWVEDALGHD